MNRWLVVAGSVILALAGIGCAPSRQVAVTTAPTVTPVVFGFTRSEPGYTLDQLMAGMPACEAGQRLGEPLDFAWPNIERFRQEMEGSDWSYYRCPQSQPALAQEYRTKMVAGPYRWVEVQWIEREQGTVAIYFDTIAKLWTYVWFLPRDSGATSHLVVVRSISSFGGSC